MTHLLFELTASRAILPFMVAAFDTLSAAKALQAAGFDQAQAEAVASAIRRKAGSARNLGLLGNMRQVVSLARFGRRGLEEFSSQVLTCGPDSAFTIAEPSRAEPSRAEPSRAEPSRAEPSRAEPSRAEPSRAEPSRAEPSRAEPSRAESRAEPSRAEPSRADMATASWRHAQFLRPETAPRRSRPLSDRHYPAVGRPVPLLANTLNSSETTLSGGGTRWVRRLFH